MPSERGAAPSIAQAPGPVETPGGAPQGGRRPSLLFLFGDEHRGQALGCAGNPDVRSPELDALAAEGVVFRNAYANTPVCTPSRGSLLTGQWPLWHRAVSNDLPVASDPQTPAIARALRAAGYRCGYVGKWHLGGWPRDRFTPPGPGRLGFDDLWAAWECHHQYFQPRYHLNDSPQPVRHEGRYEPEVQTDVALAWLDDHLEVWDERPFCLFVSYGPPHSPYRPIPPGTAGLYDPQALTMRPNAEDTPAERRDLADYYAHVTALDGQIGRLVARLRERGRLDDTLVVYSSDHGTMLGSHGRHNKQQPWEESINVPLLMRFGDRLPRGVASDLLCGVVDYAPTLLGLLGVPVPPAMQGRDLSGAIRSGEGAGSAPEVPTSVYLAEHICCDQAVRQGLEPWRGVRTARYTYVRSLRGPWLLYDNLADPYQQRNLIEDPAAGEVREAMEGELQSWMARLDDPLVPAETLLARLGLTEAWAAREAHFHPAAR